MKKQIKKITDILGFQISRKNGHPEDTKYVFHQIFQKYQAYTMIPQAAYTDNLALCKKASKIEGDVCECGVWKGGMIAGIAEMLGKSRKYYLFDSFEGLPPAKDIDGTSAISWQNTTEGADYYDNCRAEEHYALEAMDLTQTDYYIRKGWFRDTLPHHPKKPIAILRLDGDWYDSTLECLHYLYPMVNTNGLVILDDYYAWDGCSRAVHDYLSSISSVSRVHQTESGVAYIIKKETYGH